MHLWSIFEMGLHVEICMKETFFLTKNYLDSAIFSDLKIYSFSSHYKIEIY